MSAPKRAHQLRMEIAGDTVNELIGMLRHIEFLLASDQLGAQMTSGGYGSGGNVWYTINEGVTHDSYVEQLNAYLAERKAQRGGE